MKRDSLSLQRIRTIVESAPEGQGGGNQPAENESAVDSAARVGEPHGTSSANDVDWKAQARKWEERAKNNKKAAEELEKLKESQMSEQEKAAKHTRELEEKLARFEAEKKQNDWCRQVAKETGVPSDLLRGATLEEIQAHAESIKQFLQTTKANSDTTTSSKAGYMPSVGTTPGKRGSVPLSEQIKEAEKNKDLNKVMLLKAMALGNKTI